MPVDIEQAELHLSKARKHIEAASVAVTGDPDLMADLADLLGQLDEVVDDLEEDERD